MLTKPQKTKHIRIEFELHHWLKVHVAHVGSTISGVINELIREKKKSIQVGLLNNKDNHA